MKAEQDLLEMRWMMGINRIEKITTEDVRARAGAANISEKLEEGERDG